MNALLLLAVALPGQSSSVGSSVNGFSAGKKAAPIELRRVYKAGQRLTYAVKAAYTEESRGGNQITFLPQGYEQSYTFLLDILKLKADGFADARYRRPKFVFTIGDTAERGPVARVLDRNQVVRLQLSPINEVTDIVDETPKKKTQSFRAAGRRLQQADGATFGLYQQFSQEIAQLSFFLGGFDSSLDLAPRLPIEEVAPGDTWKRTVGYAPQKIKGEKAKQDITRLDYLYTYVGIIPSNGKKVHRITATLKLDTDVAEFGRQLAGEGGRNVLSKAPITLDASIEYDLDLKTLDTIRAVARSQNSSKLYVRGIPNPVQETRAKGTTTLTLVSKGTVPR